MLIHLCFAQTLKIPFVTRVAAEGQVPINPKSGTSSKEVIGCRVRQQTYTLIHLEKAPTPHRIRRTEPRRFYVRAGCTLVCVRVRARSIYLYRRAVALPPSAAASEPAGVGAGGIALASLNVFKRARKAHTCASPIHTR